MSILHFSDQAVGSSLHASKTHHRLHSSNNVSDLSNDSSPDQGYPDFPPSPDSWLGDSGSTNTTSANNNNNNANNISSSSNSNGKSLALEKYGNAVVWVSHPQSIPYCLCTKPS